MAKKVYRDCYVFFEAYGAANGNKTAGVDIMELADNSLPTRNVVNYITRTVENQDAATQMAVFKQALKLMLS
jgi:hypothetical protein